MTASFVSLVFSSIVKPHTSICSCMEGHSRLCRAVVSESKSCVQISPFSYATPCPCICQNKQLQKYNISLAWLSQNLNAASMLSLARGHFFLSFLFFLPELRNWACHLRAGAGYVHAKGPHRAHLFVLERRAAQARHVHTKTLRSTLAESSHLVSPMTRQNMRALL